MARCGSPGGDGYRLATRDVTVDLKQRQLRAQGPVAGPMRLGQFQAGQLQRRSASRPSCSTAALA